MAEQLSLFAFDKALETDVDDTEVFFAFDDVLAADVEAPRGAGVAFTAPNNSVLFVKRGDKGDHAGEWCLPGGMVERGEDDEAAARREAIEETGSEMFLESGPLDPVHQSSLNHEGGGTYTTFYQPVVEQFQPTINDESTSWHWAPVDRPPNPLHPQVLDVLDKLKPLITGDAFSEADHPRGQPGNKGQFGAGGGGTSKKSAAAGKERQTLKMPQYGLTPKPTSAHQQEPDDGSSYFKKNWAKSGSVGGHSQPTEKQVADYTAAYENQGKPAAGGSPNIGAPLHTAGLEKIGGKLGSNEGGTYEGPNGERYYVKAGKSPEHVSNELLAGSLYGLAGARTLKYRPDDTGKSIITEWEKPDKKSAKEFTPAERKEAQQDFAVHAWLANWDAAGLDFDNQMTVGGKPVTNDLGGALLFRGMGAPKGDKLGTSAGEWDTLRDAKINPQNAELFGGMSDAELKASAKKVASVKDADITAAAKKFGLPQLGDLLIARKRDIAKRAGIPVAQDAMPLAFDRSSVRSYDLDGRLHVAVCNISKANICPYVGREIPDYEKLGLEPDRIYKLYRHPDELANGAPTFNNIPLLSEHVPVSAADHQPDLVVGALGSDAAYVHPYLQNSLVIWKADAIKGVESEEQCELSAAYRYRADMEPGEVDGEPYDGVMRDIIGNHEALVKEGRAGTDVIVGDSAIALEDEEIEDMATSTKLRTTVKALMAHGAICAMVKPRLAQDAKVDYKPVLAALALVKPEKGSYKKEIPAILKAVKLAVDGKLAKDASVEELASVLDMIDAHPNALDDDPLPVRANPDESESPMQGFLKGKLSDDDFKTACDMLKAGPNGAGAHAADADDPDKKDDDEDDKPAKDEFPDKKDDDKVDKKAMDAAIKKATKLATDSALKTAQQIREAERAVRPYIGELTLAFDSADDIYKMALDHFEIDVEGVPPAAFPAMLKMVPVPGTKKPPVAKHALDAKSAAAGDYAKMFPAAARIQVTG